MSLTVPSLGRAAAIRCLAFLAPVLLSSALSPALQAQNSIQLFSPVDVRYSASNTGYGTSSVIFNSSTLNLTCPDSQITAVLSSSPDGTGNVLVDNNVNVTVTAGESVTGPTDVCRGGISTDIYGHPFQNCFTSTYQNQEAKGHLIGDDPDNYVQNDGVPPMDISALLSPGAVQVKIDLQDEGGSVTSSTMYLVTNCTQGGVTGPALISGNPIPSSNPPPGALSQDFNFNPTLGEQIGFTYDLTQAEAAESLTIPNGTIPQVGDMPIDPSTFQTVYVPQTSFATSNCLIHSGEALPSGDAACKLYTLQCAIGTNSDPTGAQCPISSLPNELFNDSFDGPSFTLQDIPTSSGKTFHEGIGFLMASEGWTGGPCSYDPAANLSGLSCPQNLLTTFSSTPVVQQDARGIVHTLRLGSIESRNGASEDASAESAGTLRGVHPDGGSKSGGTATGSYSGTGRTTHPNSSFISIYGVPEDLTTVKVGQQKGGYWINSSTAKVSFSSLPPNLAGSNLPGAASFVASPIQSLSYGIAAVGSVPTPGDPTLDPTVVHDPAGCPTTAHPTTPTAKVFNTGSLSIPDLADGRYLVYYYAQDCAGTEELKFTQDGAGNWSTGFYTYPINVDTTPPTVSTLTLSPAPSAQGPYVVGEKVLASYVCSDALSGVVRCGVYTFPSGAYMTTPTKTSSVDTSSPGSKTFTVQAIDGAGNTSTQSVKYQVIAGYDKQIKITLGSPTTVFPGSTNIEVSVLPLPGVVPAHKPTGTVQLLDGSTALQTLTLQGDGTGNGAAVFHVQGLNAGLHGIYAIYSGDGVDPAGTSAPSMMTVQPAPVTLNVYCSGASVASGSNYSCNVYTSTPAGSIQASVGTVITYKLDSAAPATVPFSAGLASFTLPTPAVGPHTLVVSYAAQGNYAAATPQTVNFTVTP